MDKREFIDLWAPLAMEHQIRYGIPASVTLAQAAIESGWGGSELYNKQNACFGVKLGKKEGHEGKDYVVREDDRKDDKFRIYESKEASFEDHSRLLVQGERYSSLSSLSATDHKGWANGLQKCGYATKSGYGKDIIDIIKNNNLTLYDKQATEMAAQRGLTCGYAKAEAGKSVTKVNSASQSKPLENIAGNWHMPLAGDMVLTDDFGNREAPTKGASKNHKGIDMRAAVGSSLFATEDNGKVVKICNDPKVNSGKSITIQYNRGSDQYLISYFHMDKINQKVGDIVKAGEVIGLSGKTGLGTGPHLHFQVEKNDKIIDPKEYLAEIAVRGNLDTTLKKGEQDVLLAHKREFQLTHNENENLLADNKKKGTDWMSMLENGIGGDVCGTLLSLLITAGFDLVAKEEMYLAEKRKNNKETEISDKDMAQYKSDGVRVDDARMKASTTYDSINNEESQSQTQRQRLV